MMCNNLHIVKGIISARQGAEIPKFTPGGVLYYKDLGNGKKVYSKTQKPEDWYTDEQCTTLYTLIDDTFRDAPVQEIRPAESTSVQNSNDGFRTTLTSILNPVLEQLPNKPNQTVNTVIPGQSGDVNNPNAAVEAAANDIVAVEKERNSNRVAKQARKEELLEQGVAWQKANIDQDTQLTVNQQNRIDRISENNSERAARVQQRLVDRNTLTTEEVEQAVGTGAEIAGKAIQGLGKAFGASQVATDSNLTKGVDSGVDAVGGMLSQMGGIAGGIGQILQIGSAAGQIIEGITGGTDQMTATDKFFDSGIGTVLGGWVNQLWGKNSDAFGIDQSMAETVGSSYGGSMDQLNEAARTADKKYGLFSSEARKKANEAIGKAKTTQNLMSNVANTAMDQRLAVQSMGEQAGLAYSMMTDGGYNQKYTYAAKHGGLLEWNPVIELEWQPQVELNWELPTFKDGGSVEFIEELEWIPKLKDGDKLDFDTWFNSIPIEYRANGYDYKKAYEVFDWDLLSKHAKDPKNNHLGSVSPVADENGNFPFLKLGTLDENKELQGEFDWYNSEEGKEHRNKYDIKFIDGRYYYVPKQLKQGGSVGDSDVPETEETTQKNVIPEGALHKNKHHMEHAEGLTKKGIPVVDEDGEQQAEIEHSEIIFTLEVTKKLEEYYEIFYSEESTNKEKEQAALDAGKLLVYQILENTEDRTGLIESCKKGGSLTLKKSTDDIIEEVLEWMPTIVVVETEEQKEDEPKKKEVDTSKEELKQMIKEVLVEMLIK